MRKFRVISAVKHDHMFYAYGIFEYFINDNQLRYGVGAMNELPDTEVQEHRVRGNGFWDVKQAEDFILTLEGSRQAEK